MVLLRRAFLPGINNPIGPFVALNTEQARTVGEPDRIVESWLGIAFNQDSLVAGTSKAWPKVGSVETRTGTGDEAPSSAFR